MRDHASIPYVGGKGAKLGEMARAGFPVPGGFCVTTRAFKGFIATSSELDGLFNSYVATECEGYHGN